MTWQPIETAPKDMKILFFPAERLGRNILPELIRVDYMVTWGSRKATHWMPLPPAPAVTSRDDTKDECR